MALELPTILEHFSKPFIPFSARFLFHIFSLLTSFQYLLIHLLQVDDLGPISLRKIEPIRREPLHTLRIIFNNLSISVLITPHLPLVWKDHSHLTKANISTCALDFSPLAQELHCSKFTLFIYKHYGHFFPTNMSNRFQHLLSDS